MKLVAKINPKNLFRSKKRTSVTRSDTSSFHSSNSSNATSSTSPESSHRNPKSTGTTTPTSVLPPHDELIQSFNLLDTDGDGRITRSELESLLNRIGGSEPIPEDELKLMIDEIDADGDGSISLTEFGIISAAFGPAAREEEIRGAFEVFDTDGDGMITAEELFAVFEMIVGDGRCTLEECRRMISEVDKNGDGFVCFEDFARMMDAQR